MIKSKPYNMGVVYLGDGQRGLKAMVMGLSLQG